MTEKELELSLTATQHLIDNIGERFGSFLEGEYFPALIEVLTERFHLEVVAPYYHRRNEQTGETAMLMNGFGYGRTENVAVIAEIKEEFKMEHLQDLLGKLQRFPTLFPQHQDKRLYGVVAAAHLSAEVKSEVLRRGLFVAVINGKNVQLTNEPQPPHDFSKYSGMR